MAEAIESAGPIDLDADRPVDAIASALKDLSDMPIGKRYEWANRIVDALVEHVAERVLVEESALPTLTRNDLATALFGVWSRLAWLREQKCVYVQPFLQPKGAKQMRSIYLLGAAMIIALAGPASAEPQRRSPSEVGGPGHGERN